MLVLQFADILIGSLLNLKIIWEELTFNNFEVSYPRS